MDQIENFDIILKSKIESIIDNSDTNFKMTRLKIKFTNGLGISIIRGPYSYGGPSGLFEIAPIDKNDELNGAILGIENDDVEGWLTYEEVVERMYSIAILP